MQLLKQVDRAKFCQVNTLGLRREIAFLATCKFDTFWLEQIRAI